MRNLTPTHTLHHLFACLLLLTTSLASPWSPPIAINHETSPFRFHINVEKKFTTDYNKIALSTSPDNTIVAVWAAKQATTDYVEIYYAIKPSGASEWMEREHVVTGYDLSSEFANTPWLFVDDIATSPTPPSAYDLVSWQGQSMPSIAFVNNETFVLSFTESHGTKTRLWSFVRHTVSTTQDMAQGRTWYTHDLAQELDQLSTATASPTTSDPPLHDLSTPFVQGLELTPNASRYVNAHNILSHVNADDHGNVVAAWISNLGEVANDQFVVSDREVMYTYANFGGPQFEGFPSDNRQDKWTGVSYLNEGHEKDLTIERFVTMAFHPNPRLGVSAWSTLHDLADADITVATTSGDKYLCQWNNHVRVIADSSKDSNPFVASSVNGTFVVAWVHKDYSILVARKAPDQPLWEGNGYYVAQSIAYPHFHRDGLVQIASDPTAPEHWILVWFRPDGDDVFHVMYSVSLDDAQKGTWSKPRVLFSTFDRRIYSTDVQTDGNGNWNIVYHQSSLERGDNSYPTPETDQIMFTTTTSDQIFVRDEDFPNQDLITPLFPLDPSVDGLGCTDMFVPSGVIAIEGPPYADELHVCYHFHTLEGHKLTVDVDILVDLEGKYDLCPYDFVAVLSDKSFSEANMLAPRMCQHQTYDPIQSVDNIAYVHFVTDFQQTGQDERGETTFRITVKSTAPCTQAGCDQIAVDETRDGDQIAVDETRDGDQTGEGSDVGVLSGSLSGSFTNPSTDQSTNPSPHQLANASPRQQPTNTYTAQVADFATLKALFDPSHPNFHNMSTGAQTLRVEFTVPLIDVTEEILVEHHYKVEFAGLADSHTTLSRVKTAGHFRFFTVGSFAAASFDWIKFLNGDHRTGPYTQGGSLNNYGWIPAITNCVFDTSTVWRSSLTRSSNTHGGAIVTSGRIGLLENTSFWGCRVQGYGAGISVATTGVIDWINNCAFEKATNANNSGGGLHVAGRVNRISRTKFLATVARQRQGGAIFVSDGGVVGLIEDCEFQDTQSAGPGAAISVQQGTIEKVVRSEFVNCKTKNQGVVFIATTNQRAQMEVTDVNFRDNHAQLCSSGLCVNDFAGAPGIKLTNVKLTGGTGLNGDIPEAGGLFFKNVASVDLENVLVDGNIGKTGGGMYVGDNARLVVRNSTFTRNSAFQGGGMYVGLGASVLLANSNFSANSANATCREQSVCSAMPVYVTRPKCTTLTCTANYNVECGNIVESAPSVEGCVQGVGGGVYLGAGASAHIHQCEFSGMMLPNVPVGEYFDTDSQKQLFLAQAGVDIFSNSLFRVTETTLTRYASDSSVGGGVLQTVAPGSAVRGCEGCGFGASCIVDEDNQPSVTCVCVGAFSGGDPYSQIGCRKRQMQPMAVRNIVRSITNEGGTVELAWDRPLVGNLLNGYMILRFTSRNETTSSSLDNCMLAGGVRSDGGAVGDCIRVPPTATSLTYSIPLETNHFFRIVAIVNGTQTEPSESTSNAAVVCMPGFERVATDVDGEFACVACPIAFYLNDNDECTRCPSNLLTTAEEGSTSRDDCIAIEDHFLDDRDGSLEAFQCPQGADCSQPGFTLSTMFIRQGYWRANPYSSRVYACPKPSYCRGSVSNDTDAHVSTETDTTLSSWERTAYCIPGHTGPFCATCIPGYAKSADGECEMCSEEDATKQKAQTYAVLVVALLLWLLVVAAVAKLSSNDVRQAAGETSSMMANQEYCCARMFRLFACSVNQGSLRMQLKSKGKILVGLVQVLASFVTVFYHIPMLRGWDLFNKMMFWSHVDVGVFLEFGSACVVDNGYTARLLLMTLTPIAMVLVLLAAVLLVSSGMDRTYRRAFQKRCQQVTLMLFSLVYPSVCTTVLQAFVCDTLDDGTSYLRADLGEECPDTVAGTWWRVYAIVMSIAYGMGVPTVYAVLLFWRREKMQTKNTASSFYFLVDVYTVQSYWYDVYELVRKLMQASVIVLIASGTMTQVAVAMLITMVAMNVVGHLKPYVNEQDSALAWMVQWQLFIVLFILMVMFNNTDETDILIANVMMALIVLVTPCIALWQLIAFRVRAHRQRMSREVNGTDKGDEEDVGARELYDGDNVEVDARELYDGDNVEVSLDIDKVVGIQDTGMKDTGPRMGKMLSKEVDCEVMNVF